MNIINESVKAINEMLTFSEIDRIKRAILSHDPLVKFSSATEGARHDYETILRFVYKLKDDRSLETKASLIRGALKNLGFTTQHSQVEPSATYYEMFGENKSLKVSITKTQVTIKVVE